VKKFLHSLAASTLAEMITDNCSDYVGPRFYDYVGPRFYDSENGMGRGIGYRERIPKLHHPKKATSGSC
jgi:hypothetical protein